MTTVVTEPIDPKTVIYPSSSAIKAVIGGNYVSEGMTFRVVAYKQCKSKTHFHYPYFLVKNKDDPTDVRRLSIFKFFNTDGTRKNHK